MSADYQDYTHQENAPLPISEQKLSEIFSSVMQRVYGWMALGHWSQVKG